MNNYSKKPRKAYKKTTRDEKLEIVIAILENNRHRKAVAEEYQVSLTSINNWVNDYQKYGEAGITSNKRDSFVKEEEIQSELARLKKIEKLYEEQKVKIEILKKFQAFLKESEKSKDTKPYPP